MGDEEEAPGVVHQIQAANSLPLPTKFDGAANKLNQAELWRNGLDASSVTGLPLGSRIKRNMSK